MFMKLKRYLLKISYATRKIFKPLLAMLPQPIKEAVKSIENKAIQLTYSGKMLNCHDINFSLEAGVNLIGYARAEMGVGESCRLAANSMQIAGIQFGILNFSMGNPATMNDVNWQHKEINDAHYRTNIFHINADQMVLAYLHYGDSVFKGRYNIGYWHWELSDFPDEWKNSFNLIDEVWVPTDFVLEAISKKSPVPVMKIPHGIEVKCSPGNRRDFFNLPCSMFLFLAMYDIQSIQERKNPHAVIEALKSAFTNDNKSAALIIKINNSKDDSRHLDKLKDEVRDYKNIYLLEGNMNRQQVNDLLNSVDCFISLHRSEGFGLGLAEAMYLGKPVIGTNWSGNTDFMNPSNSCLVDYELTRIPRDYGPYKAGQIWAEPDVEQAAYFMRKLVNDPAWRKEIAFRGQETIVNNYSPRVVGELAKHRLKGLGLL